MSKALVCRKALSKQVGGSHYKTQAIQPIEYILANGLGFCEGNVVKYISRYKEKGGRADLEKVIHYVEFLIDEWDEKHQPEAEAQDQAAEPYCQGPDAAEVPSTTGGTQTSRGRVAKPEDVHS